MADRATLGETNTGANDSEVKSFTGKWAIVLVVVFILGMVLIGAFLFWPGSQDSGGASSGNTVSRPAEP